MTPLELIYYLGYAAKKGHCLKHQKRLPGKVLSIGNITVGGTGKTPAVIAFAEEAQKRGLRPVILTRGYRGNAKGPCFVLPGAQGTAPVEKQTVSSVEDAGDEPVLMAERLRDVPVVKCADRYAGGLFAQRLLPSDPDRPFVFILDDGFQHWKLYRDLDIVLVDGINPFGNRRLLPAGRLRGPLQELKRADFFIITKIKNESLYHELQDINAGAPVFFSEYEAGMLRNENSSNELPAAHLRNKKVYAFCGIASPESFRNTIESLGGQIKGHSFYRDHHSYSQNDINRMVKECETLGCDFLVTTEKDMVKLKRLKVPDNLFCLEIRFVLESGAFDRIVPLLY